MKSDLIKSAKTKLLALGCTTYCTCMRFIADTTTATDLGTNVKSTGKNFLNEITAVYCDSICWLLFIIELLFYFFSKNEKVIGYAQKALVGTVIAYIVLNILNGGPGNVIQNTVDSIQGWMGGVG